MTKPSPVLKELKSGEREIHKMERNLNVTGKARRRHKAYIGKLKSIGR